MASRSTSGGTVLASGIRTRERKERKLYSDDWALGDEEIEGHHTFNLDEKIRTNKFDLNFVKDMTDTDFSLAYIQKNGFNWPLLFRNKNKLGIVIPGNNFTINDVRLCVGSRRMLDVMDVNTQKNVEMTMKDWQRYYESQDKDKLLNVISLEFSHTKLETLVEAPTVVRQIDWVEKVWPRHLKEAQTESTNVLEDMMYPKVQKYCLMSVSGCYTDFHIDFGGTSVWYHILKGKKIFWLIPPSERNLQLYEQWVLSGKQSDIFFGDTVEKCARVELHEGNTFFIPTGWIHAVYTPDDSLVFGGNFLHSFGIEKQLRVANVEDTTHVPQKFRYPFFTEMLWYLLERYVHVLLDRTHLTLPPEEEEKYQRAMNIKNNNDRPKEHIHLTQYELHGMKAIVMYLHSLPTSKKFVPELIRDPIALIRDVRTVVEQHRYDSPELAVTDLPVVEWWDREPVKFTVKRSMCDSAVYVKKRRQSGDEPKTSTVVKLPPNVAKVRHRRVRCKECENCTRRDCQTCSYCKDMVKYGGTGTMKQTCKLKKCIRPALPASVFCYFCMLDGWMRPGGNIPNKQPPSSEGPSLLMECIICFKISHLSCIELKFKGIDCIVNEDLPNSWECAECIQLGYNKDYKHNRTPSSRISSGGSDTNVKSPMVLSEAEDSKARTQREIEKIEGHNLPDGDPATVNGGGADASQEKSDPGILRMPTWEQLQARVPYPLVRPSWVVRPAPLPPPPDENKDDDEEEDSGSDDEEGEGGRTKGGKILPPHPMRREIMLNVFSKLSVNDLLNAMCVCRQWGEWAINHTLWNEISLAHQIVDTIRLHGVVRRQPATLVLNWAQITYDQFYWLLCRLPQLKNLLCEGLSWEVIRSLVSPYCPPLYQLNISFCEGVDDSALAALLRPPAYNRPGFRNTTSRLCQLVHLRLSGTQVGDASVCLIARSLPFLTHLDLSACLRISDAAPAILAYSSSVVSHSLVNLDLRGCHRLSPLILPSLTELPLLSTLALHPCDYIPLKAIRVWGASQGYSFNDEQVMTRAPPKTKDPLAMEGGSDCEAELAPPTVSSLKTEQERISKEKSRCKDTDQSHDKENVSDSENRPKIVHPKLRKNESNIKADVKSTSKENKIKKSTGTTGKKLAKSSKDRNAKDSKHSAKMICKLESAQLKCVITPLESTAKATAVHKHERSGDKTAKPKRPNEPKSVKKDIKCEKTNNSSEEELPKRFPSLEGKTSDACRRSERSNKGRKYKLNFVKKKAVKDGSKLRPGEPSIRKSEERLPSKGVEKRSLKKLDDSTSRLSNLKKKYMKKPLTKELKKIKAKKNIVTRSKRQKDGEEVKTKPEYEVVQRPVLKVSKEAKTSKDGHSKVESEEGLKVRISLKGGPQYASKLRKKSRDDGSSSPSSSPESKRPTPTSKDEVKISLKKSDETSSNSKKIKDKESQKLSDNVPQASSSSLLKKRKERKGSSSSNSSSSSSPSHCLPLSKKLKVELEPMSKISRRKSDSHKPSISSNPIQTAKSSSENPATSEKECGPSNSAAGSSNSASNEKLSRDRPERHHRSPRRLSMCQ